MLESIELSDTEPFTASQEFLSRFRYSFRQKIIKITGVADEPTTVTFQEELKELIDK